MGDFVCVVFYVMTVPVGSNNQIVEGMEQGDSVGAGGDDGQVTKKKPTSDTDLPLISLKGKPAAWFCFLTK